MDDAIKFEKGIVNTNCNVEQGSNELTPIFSPRTDNYCFLTSSSDPQVKTIFAIRPHVGKFWNKRFLLSTYYKPG